MKKKKPKTPKKDDNVSPSSTFSFDDKNIMSGPRAAKPATTIANASGAIIFPEHDDDDDDASDASSLFSRENIFSKKKLKNTVGKLTEKVAEKMISQKASYEQLSDGEEEKMQIVAADGGFELKYPVTSEGKQAEWKSAVDATSGRTYYYVKGTTETFWEKPAGFK